MAPYEGKAYMGDGMQGFGRFMQGIASTHLHEETDTDVTKTGHIDHIANRVTKRELSHLSGDQLQCLINAIAEACKDYIDHIYEKTDAIKDVEDAIFRIFHDYERQMLPIIYGKECAHGIYNDTTTQLLINDAFAQTVVKSATLELDTIHRYVGHIQTFATILNNFLLTAIRNFESETTTDDLDEDTDSTEVTDMDVVLDRGLNMVDFLADAATMILVLVLLKAFASLDYKKQHA